MFRKALQLSFYSIVAVQKSFYVFGGAYGKFSRKDLKTITEFNTITKQWEKRGDLKEARQAHRVVVHQSEFIVVGGNADLPTERCTLTHDLVGGNSTIKCKRVDPVLNGYGRLPGLMRVSFDYCPE